MRNWFRDSASNSFPQESIPWHEVPSGVVLEKLKPRVCFGGKLKVKRTKWSPKSVLFEISALGVDKRSIIIVSWTAKTDVNLIESSKVSLVQRINFQEMVALFFCWIFCSFLFLGEIADYLIRFTKMRQNSFKVCGNQTRLFLESHFKTTSSFLRDEMWLGTYSKCFQSKDII